MQKMFGILTDVDSEVQYVYEQDGEEHDACANASGLWIGTENAQKASNEFLGPSQNHER